MDGEETQYFSAISRGGDDGGMAPTGQAGQGRPRMRRVVDVEDVLSCRTCCLHTSLGLPRGDDDGTAATPGCGGRNLASERQAV